MCQTFLYNFYWQHEVISQTFATNSCWQHKCWQYKSWKFPLNLMQPKKQQTVTISKTPSNIPLLKYRPASFSPRPHPKSFLVWKMCVSCSLLWACVRLLRRWTVLCVFRCRPEATRSCPPPWGGAAGPDTARWRRPIQPTCRCDSVSMFSEIFVVLCLKVETKERIMSCNARDHNLKSI